MSRLEFKRLELINGAEVSGSVSSGEFLVILGRNGTGKSLLLKTLMGLLPAKSGTILLDGMPLAEANARRRKAGHDGTGRNWGTGGLFAYVPQSFKIGFPLTVLIDQNGVIKHMMNYEFNPEDLDRKLAAL